MNDLRICHFCKGPIPADEKAVEAKTKNAWAHFECWFGELAFPRDPETGQLLESLLS